VSHLRNLPHNLLCDSLSSVSTLSGESITRNTGEFAVELRRPRWSVFSTAAHAPPLQTHHRATVTYRYVTGVNNFADFIRFDSNSTSRHQRTRIRLHPASLRQNGDDQPVDFLSERRPEALFDSTFGGALVTGQRNVFQALDSITPLPSLLRLATGRLSSAISGSRRGRYDAEQILEYDRS